MSKINTTCNSCATNVGLEKISERNNNSDWLIMIVIYILLVILLGSWIFS
ncbi:MAG: hypothetical protein IJZ36_04505 [Bacilli bacterium]|nr:hypothetical protein [Bacilli bacterium]